MKTASRDLTNFQWRLVANAYDYCTLPIFCKLVFQEVCRWKSYFVPEATGKLVQRYIIYHKLLHLSSFEEQCYGQCFSTF